MWGSDLSVDYSDRNFEELYKSVGHNTGNVAFVHAIKKLIKIKKLITIKEKNPNCLKLLIIYSLVILIIQ